MRAWTVDELGGIGSLKLVEAAEPPPPGPGEATLAILAVGLNYPDLLMLSGGYQYRPPLPFTPGMEGVGRIVAVGEGVSGDLLGHRMLLSGRTGLLAERVTLPLEKLRDVPEALSDAEAAGFTMGALTAWVALAVRGRLQPGEHLLVLGAGGGMGLAAVAVGKALGARVTAIASSAEKEAAALAAGADRALPMDRAAPDFTPLKGEVDVVFDPVGGPAVIPAVKTLRWGGRYLVVGFVAGPPVRLPTNLALLKGIEILGVRAGEAGRQDPEGGRAHLAAIARLAMEGHLRPLVGLDVPMEALPQALEAMRDGRLVGKAVVRVCAD
ncbi:zinc-binding dehydrogenase [Sandaracinobacter sp. RS1-74]|uniref:zinc-binding dehydrogenase n=1 Tax=Sandaracinobacteroides sayramensis TaxID=2913411 RepID=UPI001EDC5A5E|nr:zinc-binding dehydrogenase [Sandaracinobacteroides sayramensis]MCG2842791.1 zinc-binding dehydrogenase [Sandaracinobacteroides sayramensis]